VKVDTNHRGEALRQALKHGPSGKVLIFANTLATAVSAYEDAVAEVGENACALFHKEVSPGERSEILAAYDGGDLRVLVCTGLASRGLDFRDVAHVIQYEVATNVVEFMHRIGRTARAGKKGVATTLYTEDMSHLVDGIRGAFEESTPIDKLISRKRSFKLKLKKQRRLEDDQRIGA